MGQLTIAQLILLLRIHNGETFPVETPRAINSDLHILDNRKYIRYLSDTIAGEDKFYLTRDGIKRVKLALLDF